MKENIKKFCKKPLLIISLAFVIIFFASLITMICIPNGKTYVYRYKEDGFDYTYQINLDKKFATYHTFIDENGNVNNADDIKQIEYNYAVKNGKLYLVSENNNDMEIAEINSRKIKLNYGIQDGKTTTTLVCKTNQVLFVIFIVGLCCGAVMLLVSGSIYIFDKAKDLTDLNNASETNNESKKSETQLENK